MSLGIHYNTQEHDLLTYLQETTPFNIKDGMVEALTGPGLGISIDEERVRRAAQTPHKWRNPVWREPDGGVAEW